MNKLFDKLATFAKKHQLLNSIKSTYLKRSVRFKIRNYHNIHFQFEDTRIDLDNINSDGFALVSQNFKTLPITGQTIQGQLKIQDEEIQIKLKVIYVNRLVGCKMLDLSIKDRHILSKFFSYEMAAKDLYPLKLETLKNDSDGTAHCYVGGDNCELYFVEDGRRLVKFNITLFGNYIEVSKNQNIHIGKLQENDNHSPLKYKKSNLIETVNVKLTDELRDGIIRFINNIDSIDASYKEQMLQMFKFEKK